MKRYLVQVGHGGQPPVRLETFREVSLYLSGLLVGDGRGLERVTSIGRTAVKALEGGAQFRDDPAFSLISDDRPVYVWTEVDGAEQDS